MGGHNTVINVQTPVFLKKFLKSRGEVQALPESPRCSLIFRAITFMNLGTFSLLATFMILRSLVHPTE